MNVRHPTLLVCKNVVELFTELLGRTLDPESCVRIEQHLLVCPPCTIHLGQLRTTVTLAGELRERPAARDVSPALLAAFRKRGS